MAYHSQSDVEGLLKLTGNTGFTFSSTSRITSTELAVYIADTDRYIDNRLAKYYVTPVTDAAAVAILKPVAAQLTAAKCWRILYAAQQGESNKAKEWEKLSEGVLSMIISDQMVFGSATKAGSVNSPWSSMADSTPMWKMNTDQW